jgi:DNA-binding NtrC family response regulator/tetratricopeptide (TPR) repeat protein
MAKVDDHGRAFAGSVADYLEALVSERDFAGAISLYESHRADLATGDGVAARVLLQAARAFAGLSRYVEALKIARLGQAAAEKEPAGILLAEIFMTIGAVLRDIGEHKEAERAYRDAESVFRRNDSPEGQTRALNQLAGLFFRTSGFRQSLDCLMDAIALARQLGDRKKLAFMMGNVGRISTFLGEFSDAEKHLTINVDLSRGLRDDLEEARALLSLAYVYIQQGRYAEAGERLAEAQPLILSQQSARDEICRLTYLGELHYRSDRLDDAEEVLNRALREAEAIAAQSPMAGRALRHLAEVALRRGDCRRAERFAARAMAIMEKVGDRVEVGALTKLQAQMAAAAGKKSQARSLFREALDILDATGVRFEKIDALIAAGSSEVFSTGRRLTFLYRAEEFYARCRNRSRREEVKRRIADLSPQSITSGPKAAATEPNGSSAVAFLTANSELRSIKRHLAALGKSDLPILLCGETGVGKDHMARYYHATVRPDGDFVAINCASVPDTLLESELFGYRKGAFTGADSHKDGLFVRANGGVLFLDEIGDMPLALQAKLLGVLERRTVMPLGAVSEQALDVRLVAATNQDLESMVETGSFRRDLYYRLSGAVFQIPPLRERREDIGLLATEFMRRQGLLAPNAKLPTELLRLLLAYDWPGNVRELDNKIQRLAVLTQLASDGDLVELARPVLASDPAGLSDTETLFERVEAFERELLLEALSMADGNKSEAARLLGVHEATVRTKLKRHGITKEMILPS